MYRKSEWHSAHNNVLICKKYHAAHALPENEKNIARRKPKEKTTSWKQEDINRKRRRDNVQRLLLDNFRPGDWYVTLTYATGKLPASEEMAKSDFAKYKRALRAFYNKRKLACQFIGIIEHLRGGGRVHMHIMLPALQPKDMTALKKLWPHGNVDIRFYGGTVMDAFKLADYYTKETTEKTSGGISPSRNLARTKPRKEKLEKADTWKDNPETPAGYEKIELLSYNTYTEAGYPIQVIVYQKINPDYPPRPLLPQKPRKKPKRKRKRG